MNKKIIGIAGGTVLKAAGAIYLLSANKSFQWFNKKALLMNKVRLFKNRIILKLSH